jgi:drug/metabolite transporter (DMT)-like permease
MVGFACRDLPLLAAPICVCTAVLGFWGFVALVLAGGLYGLWEQRGFVLPDGPTSLSLLAIAAWGTAAYASLMKAMRTGEVATVTPFRYSRLLFGIALGVLVFGERVDAVMAAGCAVVVASGLVIQHRTSRAELQAATTDIARP